MKRIKALVLVDTGLGLKDYSNPTWFTQFFRIVSYMPFDPQEAAVNQLPKFGYQPDDVKHILLTHMHFDHIGGLADFPQAKVHMYKKEYDAFIRRKGNLSALLKSTNPEEEDFQPEMALLGPGVNAQGQPAEHVFVPQSLESLGYLVVEGKNESEPFFEPFGPGSYIPVAELDTEAPESGRYFVAVYDDETSGHYSLAVGYRDEFSYLERMTTPIRIIGVYVWGGQSAVMVLFPYLLAEIICLLVFWRGPKRTAYGLAGTLAAFLFLATSASEITQIIINLTRAPFGWAAGAPPRQGHQSYSDRRQGRSWQGSSTLPLVIDHEPSSIYVSLGYKDSGIPVGKIRTHLEIRRRVLRTTLIATGPGARPRDIRVVLWLARPQHERPNGARA